MAHENAMGLRIDTPMFNDYIVPNGFLQSDPACHALFYYALLARRAYEQYTQGFHLDYEHEQSDGGANYRQLLTTVSFIYGVSPDAMLRYWPSVDMQFVALQLPQVPQGVRYRHNGVSELRSH